MRTFDTHTKLSDKGQILVIARDDAAAKGLIPQFGESPIVQCTATHTMQEVSQQIELLNGSFWKNHKDWPDDKRTIPLGFMVWSRSGRFYIFSFWNCFVVHRGVAGISTTSSKSMLANCL